MVSSVDENHPGSVVMQIPGASEAPGLDCDEGKEGAVSSSRLAQDIPSLNTEGPLLSENPSVPGKSGGSVTLIKVFRQRQRASDEVNLERFLGIPEVESFLSLGFGF